MSESAKKSGTKAWRRPSLSSSRRLSVPPLILIVILASCSVMGIVQQLPSGLAIALAASASLTLAFSARQSIRIGDWFQPRLFPNLYGNAVLLAPAFYREVLGNPVGTIDGWGFTLASNSATVLAFASLSFTAGLALIHRPEAPHVVPKRHLTHDRELRLRVRCGRFLLTLAIAYWLYGAFVGAVSSRGVNQTEITASDSVGSLMLMLPVVGVALVMVARKRLGWQLMGWLDWLLVGSAAILSGLNGQRASILALALAAGTIWSRSTRIRPSSLALIGVAGLLVTWAVSAFRIGQSRGLLASIMNDWSPTLLSVGTTIDAIGNGAQFAHGDTYLAAIERLIPSFIAIPLIGPPTGSATLVWRELVGFANPNQGFGFSPQAEGYLNFGVLGLVAASFTYGAVLAFANSRCPWVPDSGRHYAYVFLVAFLPFSVRSDFLTSAKTVLYSTILVSVALAGIKAIAGHRPGGFAPDASRPVENRAGSGWAHPHSALRELGDSPGDSSRAPYAVRGHGGSPYLP